ncbi:MAG: ribosome maturation factor RimM [Bacteroidales bacterium]|nr:ribosome maturation factor RimM [Bacteroidales bacterium]
MKQDELFQLGKIVRTFGTKGEVIFQIDSELLSRIKKLESVYLKINENLVPFFIELIQPKAKGQAMVKFLDVDSTEDASLLAGCAIFIPVAILPKQKGTQLFSVEIEGYTVIDANRGETGTVRTVLEMPQQALLAIDFNGKEILVPIVDEIVKKIDRKTKTIHIEAPEGLIELYLEG